MMQRRLDEFSTFSLVRHHQAGDQFHRSNGHFFASRTFRITKVCLEKEDVESIAAVLYCLYG